MKFEQDFKDALSRLSDKEKDKLILRLLKKDIVLANQLYFQLVQTKSVEELRAEVEQKIKVEISNRSHRFYSPGILMMYLRDISGIINEHVSHTKDKYGEPYLNCIMLIEALRLHKQSLNECNTKEVQKFNVYVIARVFKILVLVNGLHEDLQADFRQLFEDLNNQIFQIETLIRASIYHGLDLNWLLDAGIPEEIGLIQKDLRQRGYLK